jgi:membrane protein DedA with SNARE-associated domain
VPSWLDFNQISDWVSEAWWSYPLVFTVAAVDAFFPVVPSETVLVIGGNLSSDGGLSLPVVILFGATGAVVGDNVSYWIGHWVGEKTVRRVFRSDKAHRRLDWAERTLDERGGYIILIARFIPGGRTAVTFSAGYIRSFAWRRFIVYDVIAALTWASYATLLGYFGGKTFENHPWWGLGFALAGALTLAASVEVARHLWQRRKARKTGS